jgi:outer membrane protein OmpU
MKKVLLTGAAFVALATTPAMAEGLTLDLAGHFKGYGVYVDSDNDALRDVSIRKETEVHFTGETTLDSGLTVGVHVEANVDGGEGAIEESYMYLSGGWGRVNFGEEDGVGYLLQVAAPSADSNVDGLRQYISASESGRLDYEMTVSGASSKLTYMTPVFNGFQAGVSYTPTVSASTGTGTAATTVAGDESYEVAARYEGAFEGVGVAVGAGLAELDAVGDDTQAWNAGLDLDFAGFGFGVAYLENEVATVDTETLVIGADYEMGAYKLGASWLNQDGDTGVTELDRYTGGVSYAYGPGMSFRGSVSYIDNDTANTDETQVLLGTQVNF